MTVPVPPAAPPELVSDGVDPERPPVARVPVGVAVAVLATDLVVAFGFVVGFNQLGTQSPIDAVLPVAVFSVGIGGVLALVASVLGATARGDVDPRLAPAALAPPSLDAGGAAFGLGLMALASVGWQWGVTAQSAIVGAYGIALLIQAERGIVTTAREAPGRPAAYRLCLLVPEALLFVGFAWAALADAGIRPFT